MMSSRRATVRNQSRSSNVETVRALATATDAPSASSVGMRHPVRPAILPPSVAKRRTPGAATRPSVSASNGARSVTIGLSSISANRVAAPMLRYSASAAMPASSASPVISISCAGRGSPRRHSSCSAVAPPTIRPPASPRTSTASPSDFGRSTRGAVSLIGSRSGTRPASIVSPRAISACRRWSTARTHAGFVPTKLCAGRTAPGRCRGRRRSADSCPRS